MWLGILFCLFLFAVWLWTVSKVAVLVIVIVAVLFWALFERSGKTDALNSVESEKRNCTLAESEAKKQKQAYDNLSNSLDSFVEFYSNEFDYTNSYKDSSNDDKRINSLNQVFAEKLDERAVLAKSLLNSNIDGLPYLAKVKADYETLDLEKLAQQLDWGDSRERAKKVASIRQIRKETKDLLEQYKIYEYQLHYLYELFPALKDIVDTEYNELPPTLNLNTIEHDKTRDYLSKEEWESLSECEKNQLALDRYKESHNKSKWQIGRDYELYVGYMFEQKGYDVDYFGSNMGLEDLGRDIIAKKNGKTYIVQCKYWSQVKTIHEKHIAQLYGTTISYCIENDLKPGKDVIGMFVTNIEFSDMAKKFADMLKIKLSGSQPTGEYPMIKCNIGTDENGKATKIYHLPFDQQYDSVKIDKKKGECVVTTVAEAEALGFRRAFKWHGESA